MAFARRVKNFRISSKRSLNACNEIEGTHLNLDSALLHQGYAANLGRFTFVYNNSLLAGFVTLHLYCNVFLALASVQLVASFFTAHINYPYVLSNQ
jgi:hypothetical protein